MPRKSRRNQRGAALQYQLPDSTPIKTESISTLGIPIANTIQLKNVALSDVMKDINSSDFRNVLVERVTVVFNPPESDFSSNLGAAITGQLFLIDILGNIVPMTPARSLDRVRPTRLTFKVPLWMVGVSPAASTNQFLQIQVRSSAPVATSSIFVGVEVMLNGRISNPQVNTF